MERDTGLRRTALITGALVTVSAAGTLAVGIAGYASDSSDSTSVSDSPASPDTSSDFPALGGTGGDSGSDGTGSGTGDGSGGGGQATSGGS